MITFNLTDAEKKEIEQRAAKLAAERLDGLVNTCIANYFGSHYGNARHEKPVGYIIVDEIVSKVLTSEDFEARVAKRVKEKLEAAVEEAADAAVAHHTKKAAFSVKTGDQP